MINPGNGPGGPGSQLFVRSGVRANVPSGGGGGSTPFSNTKSISFGGTDEFLRVSNSASLQISTNLTLSAWVKGNNGAIGGIICKDDYGVAKRSYDLFQYPNIPSRIAAVVSQNGTDLLYLSSSLTAFDVVPAWHHVAMTFSNNTIKLYVDGVLDPSPTLDLNATVNTLLVSDQDVTIGSFLQNNAPASVYIGLIDEPSIWNATLTDAEIAEIYNGGDPTNLLTHSKASNLVSWWRMGDAVGDSITSILDQKGSNNATPTNMESGDIVTDAP